MKTRTMKTRTAALYLLTGLAALGGVACGSDSTPAGPAAAPASAPAVALESTVATPAEDGATAEPNESPGLVQIVDTDLGSILIDGGGQTIYGFTQDEDGSPTCFGGCADAWPPLIVDPTFDLATLPSAGQFSLVERPDGLTQLRAGKWPLYYFAGDTAAGEINGQGSGGSWFVLGEDASLVK